MQWLETAVIYGLVGMVVAASLWLDDDGSHVRRTLLAPVHLVLWPLFAPFLLTHRSDEDSPMFDSGTSDHERGVDPDLELDAVEARLLETLDELDGVAEDVVEGERHRVHELLEGLRKMQRRLHEMDRMLERSEFDPSRARRSLEAVGDGDPVGDDPRTESLQTRLENIRRLRDMRDQLRSDFEAALFKIDEISSKMALLKFADRPDEEVGELIEDVAATIEGLSEGTLPT